MSLLAARSVLQFEVSRIRCPQAVSNVYLIWTKVTSLRLYCFFNLDRQKLFRRIGNVLTFENVVFVWSQNAHRCLSIVKHTGKNPGTSQSIPVGTQFYFTCKVVVMWSSLFQFGGWVVAVFSFKCEWHLTQETFMIPKDIASLPRSES